MNGKNVSAREPTDIDGTAIWIDGQIVAWFRYSDHAAEWAREHYFGQWLATARAIPNIPPFTPEELEEAGIRADEMLKKLKAKPELED